MKQHREDRQTDGSQKDREREREGVKPETKQSIITHCCPMLDGSDFEFSVGDDCRDRCALVCVNGGQIERNLHILQFKFTGQK